VRALRSGAIAIPSTLILLREVVPGLAAVRALSIVSMGVELTTSFLAGYGALVLVEPRSRRTAIAILGVLCFAVLATRFYGPLARASFGRTLRLAAWEASPDPADVELLRRLPPLPAASLPPRRRKDASRGPGRTHHMLFASYSPRPMAACYNSFDAPVQIQVEVLLGLLPRSGGRRCPRGVGLRPCSRPPRHAESRRARGRGRRGMALPVPSRRRDRPVLAYELTPNQDVAEDLSVLGPSDGPRSVIAATVGDRRIPFRIANRGTSTFRHPDPIAPSDLLVEWSRSGRDPAPTDDARCCRSRSHPARR
jgi:hypothetical protein